MTNTIEITALNGYTYRFIELEGIFGNYVQTYFSYKNSEFRQSCTTHKNFDEARKWVEKINESVRNYKPMNTNISIPHEYDDCRKYYGD